MGRRRTQDGPTVPKHCTAEHVREHTNAAMWLLPTLQRIDGALSGRWAWWMECLLYGSIGDESIPQIAWHDSPSTSAHGNYPWCQSEVGSGPQILKQFTNVCQEARREGVQLLTLLHWFLYGLEPVGARERPNLPDRIEVLMYQDGVQALCRMMAVPGDWGAACTYELQQQGFKHTGWFPTPGSVTSMMVQMIIGEGDHRAKSVCDPCCGTGVMLLYASNHCLDLYGQDIDPLMIAWTRLQGYLFAPWMVYGDKTRIIEIREHRKATRCQPSDLRRVGPKQLRSRPKPKKIVKR